MMVVIAQVSYTNVVLTGLAGDTSAKPSLSACLFPRYRHLLIARPSM
jgi:hypothetical protein